MNKIIISLIQYLETLHPKTEFKYNFTNPHSYRGDYYQLGVELVEKKTTAEELISFFKKEIGQEYYGWKGGIYKIDKYSEVWITTKGYSSGDKLGVLMLKLMRS